MNYADAPLLKTNACVHVQIDHINLVMDNETGRSKGFGFITVSVLFFQTPTKQDCQT
jgi:hypothetical protein